jgi:histidinol phosphatase-like enzyme
MMYKATARNSHVWVRKEERVTRLQEHIKKEIKSLGIKIPEGIYCYASNIAFCSSKNHWIIDDCTKLRNFDLTNIWKVVEDGIFEGLGINDALGVFNSQSKCVLPKEIEGHYVAVSLVLYRLCQKSARG